MVVLHALLEVALTAFTPWYAWLGALNFRSRKVHDSEVHI